MSSAFIQTAVILLREGLEAMLVIAATSDHAPPITAAPARDRMASMACSSASIISA